MKKIICLPFLLFLSACGSTVTENPKTELLPISSSSSNETIPSLSNPNNALNNQTFHDAITLSDKSLCNEIKDERTQDECLLKIITTEALQLKDNQICDQLEKEELKTACQNEIIRATPTISPSYKVSPPDKHSN